MSQTTAQLVSEINGGPLAGMRNRIINGAMTVPRRGTSFPAVANGAYTLDRWQWNNSGAMVCTVSLSTTDFPNDTFQSSLKVDVTTADTSIAAGEYTGIFQPIEGVNVRDLIGTTFTLSFWVKSPKTGVHCVSFRNARPALDRAYIKEYTITTANTWEYKTVTVTGGLITAGTWDWTNGSGVEVGFTLAAGTTWQTTADAWQTGNFLATANQVNVMDNTANDFFLTGVQLEPGAIATPFERRPLAAEIRLCQRYYETSLNSSNVSLFSGNVTSGSAYWGNTAYKVDKRDVPIVVLTNLSAVAFPTAAGTVVNSERSGFMEQRTATATGPATFTSTWTATSEM